jgi:hypothetical protein
MRRLGRRLCLTTIAATALAGALAPVASSAATAPPRATVAASTKWTKISTNTGLGIASAGLFRTSDGKLHVVWPQNDKSSFSIHYSTLGGKEKLLGTGTVVSKWSGLSAYPRLIAGSGGGVRMVFTGGNGVGGSPFNLGAVYLADSTSAGTKWSLFHGSLSHSTNIPLTDTAATTESNGTPVAAWAAAGGVAYHAGTDASTPATAPDGMVTAADVVGPTLIRESDGSVSAAWFAETGASNQGYYAAKILPSKSSNVKAPGSGSKNLANNQPFEAVAFAARAGGGGYLAYCVPSKTIECSHVALWKVGASKAATLSGSSSGRASHVAIAAAPGGHLWVLWYDSGTNKIHLVRTNGAGTRFGPARILSAPPNTGELDGLQAEGSKGPVDVVALVLQNASNSSPSYWDTQVLPALTLKGAPSSVKHTKATTVTFTVTDTGDPVAGATVKFLGKTVTTNSKGVAKVTVPKGTSKDKHSATASKGGYTGATFTVKVT